MCHADIFDRAFARLLPSIAGLALIAGQATADTPLPPPHRSIQTPRTDLAESDASAQRSLTGVVVHCSGVPQFDAEVMLYQPGEPRRFTRTDRLGQFTFDVVATGPTWLAAGDRVELIDRAPSQRPVVLLVSDPPWGQPVTPAARVALSRMKSRPEPPLPGDRVAAPMDGPDSAVRR